MAIVPDNKVNNAAIAVHKTVSDIGIIIRCIKQA